MNHRGSCAAKRRRASSITRGSVPWSRIRPGTPPFNDGGIAPRRNRSAIAAEGRSRCASEGGRGFNSSWRSRPATAPILMQGFFSRAETFEYFSENQHSNVDRGNFCWRNKAVQQPGLSLSSIIFRRGAEPNFNPKKCREIPEGGEGHDKS